LPVEEGRDKHLVVLEGRQPSVTTFKHGREKLGTTSIRLPIHQNRAERWIKKISSAASL